MNRRILVAFVAAIGAAGGASRLLASAQTPVEAAVQDAYAREFGEVVVRSLPPADFGS